MKAGITQEELAGKTRLTREYISLLELDKRMPTIPVFIRLTRAVGLSPANVIQQVEKSIGGRQKRNPAASGVAGISHREQRAIR